MGGRPLRRLFVSFALLVWALGSLVGCTKKIYQQNQSTNKISSPKSQTASQSVDIYTALSEECTVVRLPSSVSGCIAYGFETTGCKRVGQSHA